jgi:hypothetical protein
MNIREETYAGRRRVADTCPTGAFHRARRRSLFARADVCSTSRCPVAKSRDRGTGFITTAAEAIGRTLGTIAGKVDQLRGDRPDSIAEAKGAPASAQKRRKEPVADDRRGVAGVSGSNRTKRAARKRSSPARKSAQPQVPKGTAKTNRSVKGTARGGTRSVPRKSAATTHKRRKRT